MTDYLRRAAVFLCPLRMGTGIRLKLLEAMAAGVPVVTTTAGYRGIELVPGRHAVVADEPGVFAREVAALLQDPARAERLARDARDFVRRTYDVSVVGREVARLLHELFGRRDQGLDGKPSP